MKLYRANYSTLDPAKHLGEFLKCEGDNVLYINKMGVIITEHKSLVCFNGINYMHPESDLWSFAI